jgi:hypothetical protein
MSIYHPDIPLGHSTPTHQTFGWCSHCPGRTLAQELAAWQTRELRRLADAASGPGRADGETQQDETQAPVDPWSIDYHRFGPARLNAAVCTCGLGPNVIIHNEPPHSFNSRLKAPHHAAVAGICTDCHHHETASCHQAASKEP